LRQNDERLENRGSSLLSPLSTFNDLMVFGDNMNVEDIITTMLKKYIVTIALLPKMITCQTTYF
jgi:hypothetical protein